MQTVNNRNEWIFESISTIDDKQSLVRNNVSNMLLKTIMMFKYTNLPEELDKRNLEIQLQVGGHSVLKEVDGKFYSFRSGLGGYPNAYYLPTIAIIANPALKYNAELKINEECVLVRNDYLYQGLMPLFSKYAQFQAEAELSLRYALINTRIPNLIQADNDSTYESAVNYINKIVDGKDLGVVATSEFLDGLKSLPYYKENTIKEIIESFQYIKGSWYNELGLSSAFNMKREALSEAETSMNDDILYPLIEGMLDCRRNDFDIFNQMYGKNVGVDLDSSWKDNAKELQLELDALKSEINTEEGESNDSE